MSDELEQLRRQMERATSPRDAVQSELDAPTVPLREAWLAFADLLESADAPPAPILLRPIAPRRRRAPVLLAAAASLLVAAAALWGWQRPTVETVLPAKIGPAVPSAEQLKLATQEAPAWDDALDRELAEMGQQVRAVRHAWSNGDDAFQLAHYSVRAAQTELDNDHL